MNIIPALGDVDNYKIEEDDVFTCAVGSPQVRKKLIKKILNRGGKFINIIGKSSTILPTAKIGNGVMLKLAAEFKLVKKFLSVAELQLFRNQKSVTVRR